MHLPNVIQLVVAREKITLYLLSRSHRDGRHKARFFEQCGFDREQWRELAESLCRHARTHEVVKVEPSPFGTRYVVDGKMVTPSRRRPMVRSVWFIGTGEQRPHLVTAYPVKGKRL